MRKLTFEFIDIKVGRNWVIQYNKLTHLNPTDKNLTKEELEHYSLGLLTENLLQIESIFHLIDLGWYPDSEIEGEFYLRLLPSNKTEDINWDNPTFELKTKSLEKILFSIEIITKVLKNG